MMTSEHTVSTGNVFADLGLENPDIERYKAELCHAIGDLIRKRNLTQEQAAKMLDMDQPKVSRIMAGKYSGFSLDRLLRTITRLGHNVTILVDERETEKAAVGVEVRP